MVVDPKKTSRTDQSIMNFPAKNSKAIQFALLLVTFFVLCFLISPAESNYLWRLPPLFKELPAIINDSIQYVMFDWFPIQVYDPEIDDFEEKAFSER